MIKQRRGNARNYIPSAAQKRLEETVAPYNGQVVNSLLVDSTPILVYSASTTGTPCSCEKVRVTPTDVNLTEFSQTHTTINEASVPNRIVNGREVLKVDTRDFMFGYKEDRVTMPMDVPQQISGTMDDDELYGPDLGLNSMSQNFGIVDRDNVNDAGVIQPTVVNNYASQLFRHGSIDCGICYRNEYLPGFVCSNRIRYVLVPEHAIACEGYSSDNGAPSGLEKIEPNGYVSWSINVPANFFRCFYSVRSNTVVLRDHLYSDQNRLTTVNIKDGLVTCRSFKFTHVVLEFDIGTPMTRVNLSGESRSLDYSKVESLSSLTVILPPNISPIKEGDVFVVPIKRLVLKVTDVTRSQTARKKSLEYSCTTRVIQPQETLRNINSHWLL